MHIRASHRAERFIAEQGGRLYIWLDPDLRAEVERPAAVELEHVAEGAFAVYADPAIPSTAELRVRRRWPFAGVQVSARGGTESFWRAVAIGDRIADSDSGHGGN